MVNHNPSPNDDEALENIIRLRSRSSIVKMLAAHKLRVLGDERAVGPLMDALNDRDKSVRLSVVRALRNFAVQDERVLDRLIQSLLQDSSIEVRIVAAEVLGELKSYKAIEGLAETLIGSTSRSASRTPNFVDVDLNEKDIELGVKAAWSLGKIGSLQVLEPLLYTLSRAWHANIRLSCVRAIRELGIPNRRVVDSLMKALKDPNKGVRDEVRLTLEQLMKKLGLSTDEYGN